MKCIPFKCVTSQYLKNTVVAAIQNYARPKDVQNKTDYNKKSATTKTGNVRNKVQNYLLKKCDYLIHRLYCIVLIGGNISMLIQLLKISILKDDFFNVY